MCKKCGLHFVIAALFLCIATIGQTNLASTDLSRNVSKSLISEEPLNLFSYNLYSKIGQSNENSIFSPYSIKESLYTLKKGARGKTKEEINTVLEKSKAEKLCELQELLVANNLFVDKSCKILSSFDLPYEQIDFNENLSSAIKRINKWVKEKTNNKISQIVSKENIDKFARIVIANAIYFKSEWKKPFEKHMTMPAPFYLNEKDSFDIETMQQTGQFKYIETKEIQAIELPYKNDALSMVIVLPKKTTGLDKIKSKITEKYIADIFNKLEKNDSKRVLVRLPKCKIEAEYGLEQTLINMGMPTAFTNSADFSGITGTKSLRISSFIHKSTIEINEEGTEASAATAVTLSLKSFFKAPAPQIFAADHPFFFIIKENASNQPIFMGNIYKPNQ